MGRCRHSRPDHAPDAVSADQGRRAQPPAAVQLHRHATAVHGLGTKHARAQVHLHVRHLLKLLRQFTRHYGTHQDLFAAAQAESLTALQSAAHRLKGAAANLGMAGLAGSAHALERACAEPAADPAATQDGAGRRDPERPELAEWLNRLIAGLCFLHMTPRLEKNTRRGWPLKGCATLFSFYPKLTSLKPDLPM